MRTINLSNQIYNKCIKESAKGIFQELPKCHPKDGIFEMKLIRPLLLEIVLIILKSGFDMYLFVLDDPDIVNIIEIYCKKDNKVVIIRKLTFTGDYDTSYVKRMNYFLESEECEKI